MLSRWPKDEERGKPVGDIGGLAWKDPLAGPSSEAGIIEPALAFPLPLETMGEFP